MAGPAIGNAIVPCELETESLLKLHRAWQQRLSHGISVKKLFVFEATLEQRETSLTAKDMSVWCAPPQSVFFLTVVSRV